MVSFIKSAKTLKDFPLDSKEVVFVGGLGASFMMHLLFALNFI